MKYCHNCGLKIKSTYKPIETATYKNINKMLSDDSAGVSLVRLLMYMSDRMSSMEGKGWKEASKTLSTAFDKIYEQLGKP